MKEHNNTKETDEAILARLLAEAEHPALDPECRKHVAIALAFPRALTDRESRILQAYLSSSPA